MGETGGIEQKRASICVLIMFTNEEHCILDTLKTTLPYASEYILLDNYSTDNTVKVCQDFLKDVKYQVFRTKWINFGHNYSYLYELGYKHSKADYLWQIDADDLVHGHMNIYNLYADKYMLKFGEHGMYYTRAQLFKNNRQYKQYLSIHGYVDTIPKYQQTTSKILSGDYYVESRRVGNRHKVDMKTKWLTDAKMLEEDLKTDLDTRDRNRCYFYLGQSYYCAEEYKKSIDIYKKRVYLQGWHEEVMYSRLQIARCYKNLNDHDNTVKYYLRCYQKHPCRAEPLYELAKYYTDNNNYIDAKKYLKQAATIKFPSDLHLFLSKDVYDYRCKILLAVCYFYLNKYNKSYAINIDLLKQNLPSHVNELVRKNNQFNLKTID